MLRAFAAFLVVFWLLGICVHLDGWVHAFGILAVALCVVDLVVKTPHTSRVRPSRVRGEPLL